MAKKNGTSKKPVKNKSAKKKVTRKNDTGKKPVKNKTTKKKITKKKSSSKKPVIKKTTKNNFAKNKSTNKKPAGKKTTKKNVAKKSATSKYYYSYRSATEAERKYEERNARSTRQNKRSIPQIITRFLNNNDKDLGSLSKTFDFLKELQVSELYTLLGILAQESANTDKLKSSETFSTEVKRLKKKDLILYREDGKEIVKSIIKDKAISKVFCDFFNMCTFAELFGNPLALYKKMIKIVTSQLRRSDQLELQGLLDVLPIFVLGLGSLKQILIAVGIIIIIIILKNSLEDFCECD